MKPGIAGYLSKAFIHSKLTPIIVIASILMGIGAIWLTPKEEEPQISVPMIDVQLVAPGMNENEVERYVTEVVERELWGIDGVEYIYSASKAHGALITVRFKVGQAIEPSLVKLHHHLIQVKSELPNNVVVGAIHSRSIDDVPFLAVTFSSSKKDGFALREAISPIARQLSSTPELSKTELLGGQKRILRVQIAPEKMALFGITAPEVAMALSQNHAYVPLGKNWSSHRGLDVELGAQLTQKSQVFDIPITHRGGRVVTVGDIATVSEGAESITRESVIYDRQVGSDAREAVTMVFSKRKGANVVSLAATLLSQIEQVKQTLPSDISVSVIRNDGESANEKTKVLIEHLIIATLSVSALIALFMGFRAALVVIVAIPVTLALTLALYYILGYTLNRVTFFALIFSIGILVDDAIVVVENIERNLGEDPDSGVVSATLKAVAEVGNPTILATFTVIAAILPMVFVRGLMGPYMKPIPVGASLAMILSLIVAFTVTPWASAKILKKHVHKEVAKQSRLDALYRRIMETLLRSTRNGIFFVGFIGVLYCPQLRNRLN